MLIFRPKSVHEGEGERKMREFKEKILSEEQAGRGEAAKTKVEMKIFIAVLNLNFRRARSQV